jgi:hypothetical protein
MVVIISDWRALALAWHVRTVSDKQVPVGVRERQRPAAA